MGQPETLTASEFRRQYMYDFETAHTIEDLMDAYLAHVNANRDVCTIILLDAISQLGRDFNAMMTVSGLEVRAKLGDKKALELVKSMNRVSTAMEAMKEQVPGR